MDKKGVEMKPYSKIILMLLTIAVFIICLSGCTKYNQINELHTKGITTYETTRVVPKVDSLEYPYYRQCIIHYELDSERTERTFFLIKFTAYGKTDTDIVFIKKDTIKK